MRSFILVVALDASPICPIALGSVAREDGPPARLVLGLKSPSGRRRLDGIWCDCVPQAGRIRDSGEAASLPGGLAHQEKVLCAGHGRSVLMLQVLHVGTYGRPLNGVLGRSCRVCVRSTLVAEASGRPGLAAAAKTAHLT